MKTLIVPNTRTVLRRIAALTFISCLLPAVVLAAVLQGWKCEPLPTDTQTQENAQGLPCAEDSYCDGLCERYQYDQRRRGNCVQTGNPDHRCNQQPPVRVEQRVYSGGSCKFMTQTISRSCICEIPPGSNPSRTNYVTSDCSL